MADFPPTDDEVKLLFDLVNQPSFSGEETQVSCLLTRVLNERGWSARSDSAGNVIAEKGRSGPLLLFLGHIDTVSGWLEVKVENGELHGRGSVDAKGPLAAFVAGVARAEGTLGARSGECRGIPARIVLVGAVGEEQDSRGAKAIVSVFRPDYCVVGEPSEWEGVTLGYKGFARASLTVEFPTSHGSGRYATATESAVSIWNSLRAKADAAGGFESLTASLESVRTERNDLSDIATARVVFRLPPGASAEGAGLLLSEAVELARTGTRPWPEDARVAVDVGDSTPAYVAPKNNLLVRSFLSAIREIGGVPRFKRKTGTSDMNLVAPAWNCPILAYGPGDSSLDHTPRERLSLREYGMAIEVWRRVLGHWPAPIPGQRKSR